MATTFASALLCVTECAPMTVYLFLEKTRWGHVTWQSTQTTLKETEADSTSTGQPTSRYQKNLRHGAQCPRNRNPINNLAPQLPIPRRLQQQSYNCDYHHAATRRGATTTHAMSAEYAHHRPIWTSIAHAERHEILKKMVLT